VNNSTAPFFLIKDKNRHNFVKTATAELCTYVEVKECAQPRVHCDGLRGTVMKSIQRVRGDVLCMQQCWRHATPPKAARSYGPMAAFAAVQVATI
jgi:hypothetical protein